MDLVTYSVFKGDWDLSVADYKPCILAQISITAFTESLENELSNDFNASIISRGSNLGVAQHLLGVGEKQLIFSVYSLCCFASGNLFTGISSSKLVSADIFLIQINGVL